MKGKKYKTPGLSAKPAVDTNRAPSANDVSVDTLSSEPVPKAFKRVMIKNSKIAKAKLEKKTTPKQSASVTHAMKPGESFRAYHRRLDDEIRKSVNAAAKAETATAIKRKRRLNERKLKREGKLKKSTDEANTDKEFPKREVIPFGFQAQEPPKISVIPKKVGGGAGAARALAAALEAKEKKGKEFEKQVKAEKREEEHETVGRKIKFKNLPMVKQKSLMEERHKAIEQYRQAKSAK